jgi:hypothetical protein
MSQRPVGRAWQLERGVAARDLIHRPGTLRLQSRLEEAGEAAAATTQYCNECIVFAFLSDGHIGEFA